MAPTFVIQETERHVVVSGPYDEKAIQIIKGLEHTRFLGTIEAETLKEARSKVECPKCEGSRERLRSKEF